MVVGHGGTRFESSKCGFKANKDYKWSSRLARAAQGAHSILVKVPYIFIVGFYLFFVCVCV